MYTNFTILDSYLDTVVDPYPCNNAQCSGCHSRKLARRERQRSWLKAILPKPLVNKLRPELPAPLPAELRRQLQAHKQKKMEQAMERQRANGKKLF